MAKAKTGKPMRTNHYDDPAKQVQFEGNAMPMDVGHKMVKAGKATHPHWRGSHKNAHSKRMYSHATTAHGHTKVGPF